jgi:hypothetical protein
MLPWARAHVEIFLSPKALGAGITGPLPEVNSNVLTIPHPAGLKSAKRKHVILPPLEVKNKKYAI